MQLSYLSNSIRTGSFRSFSCSALLNQKWSDNAPKIPINPTARGVLTDKPDYTFLDGRLTPYCMGQARRLQEQKEVLGKIIKFTGEIDFAVERHKKLLLQKENEKQKVLESKLKPKGEALLKSK